LATPSQDEPSFSPSRRWRIACHVVASSIAVLAVVILANYVSFGWFHRFRSGSRASETLSPLSLKLVRSLTNQVKITLFYDRDEPLYSTIADLADQYHNANPRITVQSVDYNRDPGAGLKVREACKQLLPGQKDVVIFECGGRQKIFQGNALTRVVFDEVADPKEQADRRKLTLFEGEKVFTSVLAALTSPNTPKAYFLQGHGEHPLQSADIQGYIQFLTVLRQNNVEVEPLDLLGTNRVPADCQLLVIAGPQTRFTDPEIDKIDTYLGNGGRLFALFRSAGMNQQTGALPPDGLEPLLERWGVEVTDHVIWDPQNSPGKGYDFVVSAFSATHPVVNPLIDQGGLHMMPPRPVARLRSRAQAAEAFRVEEIASTGDAAFPAAMPARKARYPVMVAVDATLKGVASERGSTRLLVAGDSCFLDNQFIVWEPNRSLAAYAVNWLLDRPQLIDAIGPRPVRKYRIIMTKSQLQTTQWLLMGAMPMGAVLVGAGVWLRRRR